MIPRYLKRSAGKAEMIVSASPIMLEPTGAIGSPMSLGAFLKMETEAGGAEFFTCAPVILKSDGENGKFRYLKNR